MLEGERLLAQQLKKVNGSYAFAFDGRRNTAACIEDVESSIVDSQGETVTKVVKRQGTSTEEYVAMLSFPGAHFINFKILKDGEHGAMNQAQHYYEVLVEIDSVLTLRVIMCDGTVVVGTIFITLFNTPLI